LQDWLRHWANRPVAKHGKPVSRDWAKSCIKTIRDFVRWLHRSSLFDWSKPAQYEVLPMPVRANAEDQAAEVQDRVRRYNRDELGTLWQYAAPRERVFLLLGLNCGFGLREIATLRLHEVDLDKGSIQRKRTEPGVFARWKLWPETVEALRWWMANRPKSESPYVFLTEKGRPIVERTKGGNPNQTIPNAWGRLYRKILKDKAGFPRLSFNKLRKTGSKWIRRKFGREVADLYLSHGRLEIVDASAERPFNLVAKATDRLRRVLEPVFSGVEIPFPAEKTRNPNYVLSLATIARMKELRGQGMTLKEIAKETGTCVQTVLRHTRKEDA
jgi:integrase